MFDLEKHERAVLVLLILTVLAGFGFDMHRKLSGGADVVMERFDPDSLKSEPLAGAHIGAPQKVNVNDAGMDELTRLNGIGKKLALRICAYRNEHGDFACAEDIKKVKGIGGKLFDKIKNDISFE